MRDLFDALIASGAAAIRALVDERRQEDVQLDFKLKRERANGNFEYSDRVNLGKALSGFANSQGGLLIFGLDARKVNGVDAASECQPIADVAAFESQAKSLVGQLIMPKHDGIHVASIKEPDGSGYLLVFVERSERRPHRSEAKDDKYYYKRAGDSFFQMEHYDIEDSFRRNALPELSLRWGAGVFKKDKDERVIRVSMVLYNFSKITAKNPIFGYRPPAVMRECDEPAGSGRRKNRINGIVYIMDPGISFIHPGQGVIMQDFDLLMTYYDKKLSIRYPVNDAQKVDVECCYGCENVGLQSEKVVVDPDVIIKYLSLPDLA